MPRSTSSVLKKYKCPYCARKFGTKIMRDIHKKTHKGVKFSGQLYKKRVVPKKGSIAYILN